MAEDRIAGRINIKYKPGTGNAKEERELPLKLMVLGDFTGGGSDQAVKEREPLELDKHNFESRLKAQNVKVDVSVPDRLSDEEGAQMNVQFNIRNMKDFTPDNIVEQVDELRQLRDLREILSQLKNQFINEDVFRSELRRLLQDPDAAKAILDEISMSSS